MKYFLCLSALLLGVVLGASILFVRQHEKVRPSVSQTSETIDYQTPSPTINSISEITLEYNYGLPFHGSRYKVTLRRDGAAHYIGKGEAERIGRYKGSIGQANFLRLANMVEQCNYFALKANYYDGFSDTSTRTTSVLLGNNRKTIVDSVSGSMIKDGTTQNSVPPQLLQLEKRSTRWRRALIGSRINRRLLLRESSGARVRGASVLTLPNGNQNSGFHSRAASFCCNIRTRFYIENISWSND